MGKMLQMEKTKNQIIKHWPSIPKSRKKNAFMLDKQMNINEEAGTNGWF